MQVELMLGNDFSEFVAKKLLNIQTDSIKANVRVHPIAGVEVRLYKKYNGKWSSRSVCHIPFDQVGQSLAKIGGVLGFTICPECELISWNIIDIQEKYCSNCSQFY